MRLTASSRVSLPSLARSTAILSAALRRAFAVAGLEHPEAALFDRELDVLHVAVVGFEFLDVAHELGEHLRHAFFERGFLAVGRLAFARGQRLGRADARDDVLALGVDQILAVEGGLARRGIAREGDAGGASRRPCCRRPSPGC